MIQPVLLYNCEVWFPEEYLPVLRATDRANRNGTTCDLLSFEEKRSYEKVHIKYCKAMLGIKNLAKKSCRFVHFNKKKVKKKKSWIDTEFKDLKKTVLDLGSEVKKQRFNLQLRVNYFTHCKKLKKKVKNKKYQFTKGLYEKLLNWKETDPKQYWQVLNSLKKGDKSSKNPEIQVNFEKIIEHFKSQGSCKNYNVSLKNKVENHIIQ